MGAGRFFALLAVVTAFSAATPSTALGTEAPAAGSALLQAQSVSPYAALSQGDGVELRDAQNRPISRAALARELRAGAAAESAPVASKASRLLADFLDRLSAPVSTVRGGAAPTSRHAMSAAGTPRPPKSRIVFVVSRRAVAAPAARPTGPAANHASSVGRAFSVPLRI